MRLTITIEYERRRDEPSEPAHCDLDGTLLENSAETIPFGFTPNPVRESE